MTARVTPPNSILLILDPDYGVLPEAMGGAAIASTSSALVVGTLAEFDGPTQVAIGEARDRPTVDGVELRWSGRIETAGRLAVLTAMQEVVLEMPVESVAEVEVWSNDEYEPDRILVIVR